MKQARKAARQRLKDANKAEFEKLLENANLTPTQEKIARLHFVKDWTICKIALSLSCCAIFLFENLDFITQNV